MKTVEIGCVVASVKKWNPKREGNGAFTYVDISSIDQHTKTVSEPSSVDAAEAPSRARQLIAAGDVLVSTVRPNLNAVAYVKQELDGATASTGYCVLRPHPSDLDGRYLFHWVRAAPFVAYLVQRATGASYPAVSDKIVKGAPIPLPPIEEQRRIAAVLDAAEALRTKRRQALTKLDELPRAVFHEVFGDPVRNERGWPLHTLRDVCLKIQIGPFGSLLHKSDYVEGGIPLVNPMHIVGGTIRPHRRQTISLQKYAQLEAYCMEVGDVVMGRRGEMGRVAIVGECEAGFLCGSGSLYLRPDPDSVTSPYIAAALSSARGRRRLENSAQGVTMLNLNSEIVGGFELGLPPIELQREFSTTLMAQGELKAGLRGHATALDTLFASLQQRAFRGEL
ncbi:MAG: restriction endonuclease subunit S [Acidimicrobiaceae bacterium]|nr:restriction endonuclease subunit S [Acidimicrobiaceae bacterium]